MNLLKCRNPQTSSKYARCLKKGRSAPHRLRYCRSGVEELQNLFVLKENDMAFRPLHDRILVRRIEADEKTAGGIIIPALPRRSRRKAKWSP